MSSAPKTYLLLDDDRIERSWNVKRVLQSVRKYPGNPIMRPETPAEGSGINLYGTVLRDANGLFRMWYQGYAVGQSAYHALYATSHDGVHWERPNLGLIEYEGNRANNLVSTDMALVNVIEDLRDPDPDRRYKSLYFARMGQLAASRVCVAFSANGLQWNPHPGNPVIEGSSDTHTLLGWDEEAGCYVAYTRPGIRSVPGSIRVIGRSTSPDFVHWSEPDIVLAPDDADPPALEFYGMPVFQHAGLYIGLPWAYHAYREEPPVRMEAEVDVQLAFSRDGIRWQRLRDTRPFISRGGAGAFDARGIYTAKAPVRVGDEFWFYYGGAGAYHNDGSRRAAYSLGLAKIRIDRFVALEPEGEGDEEGWLETTPFRCEGTRLTLNVHGAGGYVAVAVLDETGVQIPGYHRIDSVLVDGDGVALPVSWRERASLVELQGRSIRLKFYIHRAKLFAFTVDQG
jgi:hypothetical protein